MKIALYNHTRLYNYAIQTANSGIVGVYGVSGSGKSSLLDAIAGYDDEVKGSIEFNGKSISGIIKCAYMNQHPILFEHWTVKQNLEFVKQYHKIPYDDYMQKLQCVDLLNKYPKQLSGGEKQRIALIRTLIQHNEQNHDCHLVLLDEPFSALNRDLRRVALSLLQQQTNCLIFLVTHEISELYEIADELLYIDNGVIEYHGNITEVMAQHYQGLPIASKLTINGVQNIIYANDVSISLEKNPNSSIINQIVATIIAIKDKDNTQETTVIVKLEIDKTNILYAEITKNSLNKLGLVTQQKVIANFKAVAHK
ncbi:MAG: ATP-binding cassette domain-containing protein [Proteobacteria bacterium]|nr:ATP-binding cassette domain-containing protein [Pseudomonadota bacterium]